VGETVSLKKHLRAIRESDLRFGRERDRRYTEVRNAEEKALHIKEVADLAALQLARDIQTYKDQAHNGLLQQIDRERARYPTKDDLAAAIDKLEATIKPLYEYVATQQGRSGGTRDYRTDRSRALSLVVAAVAAVLVGIGIAVTVVVAAIHGGSAG